MLDENAKTDRFGFNHVLKSYFVSVSLSLRIGILLVLFVRRIRLYVTSQLKVSSS